MGLWHVSEVRDTAYDGSAEADNPFNERTRISVPLLTADVRVTEAFGLQVATSIPDITRTATVMRASGPFNYKEQFKGVGDTSVLGWYRPRPVADWNVVLNFGASLPTGRSENPRFRDELDGGSLVPMTRLQRGSGSLDPLFGFTATRRLAVGTAFTSLAARTPLFNNGYGLRTGASWEANGGLMRDLYRRRIVGFARLGWLHRNQDSFRGIPVLEGGGNWIYLTPGVTAMVGKGINVQFEIKLPLHRALANKQLDSPAIFQFGISRAFF